MNYQNYFKNWKEWDEFEDRIDGIAKRSLEERVASVKWRVVELQFNMLMKFVIIQEKWKKSCLKVTTRILHGDVLIFL